MEWGCESKDYLRGVRKISVVTQIFARKVGATIYGTVLQQEPARTERHRHSFSESVASPGEWRGPLAALQKVVSKAR